MEEKKAFKYIEIENDILQKILSGKLRPGDRIEPEVTLCSQYHTSRMTANKALQSLSSKGYIKRIAGKGSFVCDPSVKKILGRSRSFSEDMKAAGLTPGAKLLEYRMLRGEEIPRVSSILGASQSDFIHYFSRLRTGDDLIISISYTYVPCKVLPALDIAALEHSFYEYVRSQRTFSPHIYNYAINATLPTEEQKRIMGIQNVALLKIAHPTYLDTDEIFEYTETYYIGSRYTYFFSKEPSPNA